MTEEELIEKNKHISTAEIKQDIADTEAEIGKLEQEESGYRTLGSVGNRMADFQADARKRQIEERQEFIAKLIIILNLREDK